MNSPKTSVLNRIGVLERKEASNCDFVPRWSLRSFPQKEHGKQDIVDVHGIPLIHAMRLRRFSNRTGNDS
jgi:hypothetical protein